MKLELQSGHWIEMRGAGELTAGDKSAMHSVTRLPIDGSELDSFASGVGKFSLSLGMVEDQTYAVLARIIFGWSYPYCLPKDDISRDEDDSRTYADSLRRIPLDDWNEVEDAIAPHMAKLRSGPKGRKTTSSTSSKGSPAKGRDSRTG
jgi:hypothetical protein